MLESRGLEGRIEEGLGAKSQAMEILSACRRVPILRDLPQWVAVNPWMGWSSEALARSVGRIHATTGAQVLPPLAWYVQRMAEGGFSETHLRSAARRRGLDPRVVVSALEGALGKTQTQRRALPSEAGGWHRKLVDDLAMWLARRFGSKSDGEAAGMFAAWRADQEEDPEMESSLPGWNEWFRSSCGETGRFLEGSFPFVAAEGGDRSDAFASLFRGVSGWAAWLRGKGFLAEDFDHVRELLAMRLAQEAAVQDLLDPPAVVVSQSIEDIETRICLQEAFEDAWMENLALKEPAQPAARSGIHAVFCIDVRSEPFRRALEGEDPGISTGGFAGFFGMPLQLVSDGETDDFCPALLGAGFRGVRSSRREAAVPPLLGSAANLPAVEVLGWKVVPAMVRSLWRASSILPRSPHAPRPDWRDSHGADLSVAAKAKYAKGLLDGLGERALSRVVVLVGHRGRSANNAHDASLHCGACGGHGGAENARAAVSFLNDPRVRERLQELGMHIPHDTLFVAAEHDTTLDVVEVLDRHGVPSSHGPELARLEEAFRRAGNLSRQERAKGRGGAAEETRKLLERAASRAAEIGEVRTEWGLAGNAGFLVAPRDRSRGVNLEGRFFLHDYDASRSGSERLLETILTAPVVVASWINLQYFGSTVDPKLLGAGPKNLHNRIGRIGVVLGDQMDLRVGLPEESVFEFGGNWRHEPLRLQVVVEDSRQRIDGILRKRREIGELVEHGWVRMFALEGAGLWLRTESGWERMVRASD